MTLEQKIGQFFFPAAFINDTEENIQETERLIRDYNIGGLTFFHSRASAATNYENTKKVVVNQDSCQRLKELICRYQKCATTPLLMSIDAEWGLAMRVEKTPQYPYALTLGALPLSQSQLIYQVGKQIGLDLKSVGIHYNLAPLADINTNPNNPVIGYRSFGENKDKVSAFALEYLKGMNDVGILGCLKHFPGHGNTHVDSHLGLPVLEENLEQLVQNELVPFIDAIKNNVDSIMIGHLAVPVLNKGKNTSATLSKPIIETLLRKQLGYTGLIISDALNMRSVCNLYQKKGQLEWEAFNAGNDVLCFAENIPQGIQEILKNATPQRIEQSYNRLLKCKEKAGIINTKIDLTIVPTTDFDFETASNLKYKIAQNCLTKIRDNNTTAVILEASKKGTLAKISFYKDTNTVFFKGLSATFPAAEYSYKMGNELILKNLEKQIEQYDTLLLSLFIPKVKPLNKFDIEEVILNFLKKALTTKKCILYLFGNPYALRVIPKVASALGIVLVYQEFDEFQEFAAKQLINNLECLGVLPINIDFP